jgi:hypothetical protein
MTVGQPFCDSSSDCHNSHIWRFGRTQLGSRTSTRVPLPGSLLMVSRPR